MIEGQERVVIAPRFTFEKRLVRDFEFKDSYKFKLVLTWRLKRLRRAFSYDGS